MQSSLVFLLLVGVAVAQQGFGGAGLNSIGGANSGGLGGGAGAAAGGAAAGGAAANSGNPWGPKAYGMGLNNPWALPPNPFMMQRALALVNAVPNALVRVDVNGEISITNQFGQEIDVLDGFGNDLTDLID